jgi:group II intron reverse transcriptase/maturase
MLPDRAIKRLLALPEISTQGKRINGLCRLMEVPELWLQAYANINANTGAMTPGVGPGTMAGFSPERAANLIARLKDGRYRPNPVRSTYVPQPKGKKRPLGMPSGDDTLVQEMGRMLLDPSDEPVFSNWSHGFRPNRSCPTALKQVERWDGMKWLVEGDIEGFFDNIDHEVMVELLAKKIDDKRFIDLIRPVRQAGYREDWRYHGTYSGTPQGGILSPILANIYLHELDMFMEAMMAGFNKGRWRGQNQEYRPYTNRIYRRRVAIRDLRDRGERTTSPAILELKQQLREYDRARKALQPGDPLAPTFRRLHYCRYADATLVGVIGSKPDAEEVMKGMKEFNKNVLHLSIAESKSRISQAIEGTIFLGYEVISRPTDKVKRVKSRPGLYTANRTVAERMTLRIPEEKLLKFCHDKRYGNYVTLKTTHRAALLQRSDAEIILTFNAELRGLANYSCLANSARTRPDKWYYLWKGALFKTLAAKHDTTVAKTVKRLKRGQDFVYQYAGKGRMKDLQVFSLRRWKPPWNADRSMDIKPHTYADTLSRPEIIERLHAGLCEYCGVTKGYVEVHHVRKLKDVSGGQALWQQIMAARRRKKLVLCSECHDRLHKGELPDWRWRSQREAESRVR